MAQLSPPESAPASILVVEDQPEARVLLRFALESTDHQVAEAETVAGARETLERGPVDLVLCDIQLGPGEPGETQIEVGGRTFSFAVTPIKDADYVYLYGHDITRLKETERELVRLKEQAQAMALHDPLTGLPNRTLLEDRLAQTIAQSVRL